MSKQSNKVEKRKRRASYLKRKKTRGKAKATPAAAKEAAAAPKDAKPSRPLAVRVDQLKISAARLAVVDLTMKRPFTKFVGP